mgnify:CR=1 FL=1
MAHCYYHALSSVRKWGGVPEDYLPLHQWFDQSKAILADPRHRALRHHAEGIFMLEALFGATLVNADGRTVPVRLIGEQHVREDFVCQKKFAAVDAVASHQQATGQALLDPVLLRAGSLLRQLAVAHVHVALQQAAQQRVLLQLPHQGWLRHAVRTSRALHAAAERGAGHAQHQ